MAHANMMHFAINLFDLYSKLSVRTEDSVYGIVL